MLHTDRSVPPLTELVYPAAQGTHADPPVEYEPGAHAVQAAVDVPVSPGCSDEYPASQSKQALTESSPVVEYLPKGHSEQSVRAVTVTSLPLYDAVDGSAMEVSLLVLVKAEPSMATVLAQLNVTVVRLLQDWKALLLIVVTDAGMMMSTSLALLLNVL